MASDKKNRSARLRFALPSRLGAMSGAGEWTQEADEPALRRALEGIAPR
jgi:3-dehydroquinate synthetase